MSVDSSELSLPGGFSSWRFGLRGLLLVTMAAAVGAADVRWRGEAWSGAPRAMLLAVSVMLIAGLLTQAIDVLRSARDPRLAREVRSNRLFAAVWRFAAVGLLVGYHVFEHADAVVLASSHQRFGWWIDLVYCLMVVVIIASTRQVAGIWRWMTPPFALLLAWVFSVTCFALGLYERLKDSALVESSLDLEIESTVPLTAVETELSLGLTISGSILLPFTLGALYFVARGARARWRRILYGALFGLGLTASSAIFLCNARLAWTALTPYLNLASTAAGFDHFCRVAGPFLLTLGTLIAYCWTVREAKEPSQANCVSPQDVPPFAAEPYLHERRLVLLLLGGLLLWDVANVHLEVAQQMMAHTRWDSFWQVVGLIFSFEPGLPLLLTSCVALHAAFAGRGKTVRSFADAAWRRELPLARFTGIWLAVMATTVLAVATLALFGYSLWLSRLAGA